MLKISSVYTLHSLCPIKLLLIRSSNSKILNPKTSRLSFSSPLSSMSSSSPAPVKVVAEYAKSGRSSCKKCSKAIPASTLRLGLASKDPRGFDMTRWHHLACFPFSNFDSISASHESITGFSSLKSSDQDSVKQLLKDGAASEEMSQNTYSSSSSDTDSSDGFDPVFEVLTFLVKYPPHELLCQEASASGSSSRRKGKKVVPRDRATTSPTMLRFDGSYLGKRWDNKADEKEDKEPGQGNLKRQKLSTSEEGAKLELEIAMSASDVKNKYKDATLLPKWKAFQTVIFLERDDGLHDSTKIAAFDFDGCLAKTSVKRIGADAWSLMYPSIPEKLQSLYNDGYKLVIFTNESNIERWKNKRQAAVDSKIGRLENFIKLVKVPIQVFIACGLSSGKPEDLFRKPKPGMWSIMEKEFNSGLTVDMDQSFYVGDAAGRPDDHSDADIKFAQAIGLKFYVPEEFFIS